MDSEGAIELVVETGAADSLATAGAADSLATAGAADSLATAGAADSLATAGAADSLVLCDVDSVADSLVAPVLSGLRTALPSVASVVTFVAVMS